MKKNICLFAIFILITIQSFGQRRTYDSLFENQVDVYTRDGNIVFENNSANSLTIEIWRNNNKVDEFLLSPDIGLPDQNKFFQRRSISSSREIVNFNKISKDVEGSYFKINYDEAAYNNDIEIIKEEIESDKVMDTDIPFRNSALRMLGADELLFYSNLYSIAVSNDTAEEKFSKAVEAFTKKTLLSKIDNERARIAATGHLDLAKRLNDTSQDQEILKYGNYCTERYVRNEPTKHFFNIIDFHFYPRHTLILGISYPVQSTLRSFQGEKYSLGELNSKSPISQTFSIDVTGTILGRQQRFYDGRFLFSYGGFYEKGQTFYSKEINADFPLNTGYTHRKFGLQAGTGARWLENNQLMGLEGEVLIGYSQIEEAEVALDNSESPSSFSIGTYDDSYGALLWRARIKVDIKYVILAFDYKREFAIGKGVPVDRFYLTSYYLTLGIPIHRVLKIK
ncbi:hypothetical protein [Lewinella cohaerens]|uniref:hypothetical protein n=1 Tax=Lewinella cohaerens TaxID=70995 RepID=UPI00036F6BDE|nr:hypothetical protein [Lewinella cohaerens]